MFFFFSQKKIVHRCVYFFGFKSCTLMTFMILLKPHVWEKYGPRVKCKNAFGQSIAGFLNLSQKLLEV